MILLRLNKITNMDILKEIYTNIYDYKLLNQIFTIYRADIKSKSYNIENLIYSVLEIELDEFEEMDESDIENVIYDLIDLNTNVLFVKNNISEKLRMKVESICLELGLNYRYSDEDYLNREIDLSKLTIDDLYTIYEIYELNPPKQVTFSPLDFAVHLNIDNDGIVTHEGAYVDILKNNFMSIFSKCFQFVNNHKENNKEYLFKNYLYEPWGLLDNSDGIEDKIENYKLKIFEKLKNIEPEEYAKLDTEIVNLLNHFEYVQFNNILEIISGEDDFIKYYK